MIELYKFTKTQDFINFIYSICGTSNKIKSGVLGINWREVESFKLPPTAFAIKCDNQLDYNYYVKTINNVDLINISYDKVLELLKIRPLEITFIGNECVNIYPPFYYITTLYSSVLTKKITVIIIYIYY